MKDGPKPQVELVPEFMAPTRLPQLLTNHPLHRIGSDPQPVLLVVGHKERKHELALALSGSGDVRGAKAARDNLRHRVLRLFDFSRRTTGRPWPSVTGTDVMLSAEGAEDTWTD